MNAKVVCRQLGFPEGGKFIVLYIQHIHASHCYCVQEKNTFTMVGIGKEDSLTLNAQGMRRNSLIAHMN